MAGLRLPKEQCSVLSLPSFIQVSIHTGETWHPREYCRLFSETRRGLHIIFRKYALLRERKRQILLHISTISSGITLTTSAYELSLTPSRSFPNLFSREFPIYPLILKKEILVQEFNSDVFPSSLDCMACRSLGARISPCQWHSLYSGNPLTSDVFLSPGFPERHNFNLIGSIYTPLTLLKLPCFQKPILDTVKSAGSRNRTPRRQLFGSNGERHRIIWAYESFCAEQRGNVAALVVTTLPSNYFHAKVIPQKAEPLLN